MCFHGRPVCVCVCVKTMRIVTLVYINSTTPFAPTESSPVSFGTVSNVMLIEQTSHCASLLTHVFPIMTAANIKPPLFSPPLPLSLFFCFCCLFVFFFALYPDDDEDGKAPTQPLLKKGRQCILGFVLSLSSSLSLYSYWCRLCLADYLSVKNNSSLPSVLSPPLLFLYSTMRSIIVGKSVSPCVCVDLFV